MGISRRLVNLKSATRGRRSATLSPEIGHTGVEFHLLFLSPLFLNLKEGRQPATWKGMSQMGEAKRKRQAQAGQ
jgi:hypothetical protein